jgi:hypothetical protein
MVALGNTVLQKQKVIINSLVRPGRRSLSSLLCVFDFSIYPFFYLHSQRPFLSFFIFRDRNIGVVNNHREIIMVCRRATFLHLGDIPIDFVFQLFFQGASLLVKLSCTNPSSSCHRLFFHPLFLFQSTKGLTTLRCSLFRH